MEWLDHMICICLSFKEVKILFSNCLYHLTFLPAVYDHFTSSISLKLNYWPEFSSEGSGDKPF